MYFIRNGRYSVHVNDKFITKANIKFNDEEENNEDENIVNELFDGDHFGEIGLIYETKRTATVRSENYGTLAKLSKSSYQDMLKTFESMSLLFKQQMFKYDDKILRFLEFELDKISYFRNLKMQTK